MVLRRNCEDSTDPFSADKHAGEIDVGLLVSHRDNFDIHVVDLYNEKGSKVKINLVSSLKFAKNDIMSPPVSY
jgi:hypothetical protein